ncbi:hypothetical protein OUZ56_025495 [Daphnia magna]|uniref:Uncharacterized protein n=1 Tax=Daphnia magna TaxID=35525 RepID=A0ABQ9ZK13_9CRUS|nr:hypothetical protein OUZ56_025495 [Daphnia magna]
MQSDNHEPVSLSFFFVNLCLRNPLVFESHWAATVCHLHVYSQAQPTEPIHVSLARGSFPSSTTFVFKAGHLESCDLRCLGPGSWISFMGIDCWFAVE